MKYFCKALFSKGFSSSDEFTEFFKSSPEYGFYFTLRLLDALRFNHGFSKVIRNISLLQPLTKFFSLGGKQKNDQDT
jgi:hypothetical protein